MKNVTHSNGVEIITPDEIDSFELEHGHIDFVPNGIGCSRGVAADGAECDVIWYPDDDDEEEDKYPVD